MNETVLIGIVFFALIGDGPDGVGGRDVFGAGEF